MHLLLLDHSAADQSVYGRFCKDGADFFGIAMAVAVIRNVDLVRGNVGAELANRAEKLLALWDNILAIEHRLQPVH